MAEFSSNAFKLYPVEQWPKEEFDAVLDFYKSFLKEYLEDINFGLKNNENFPLHTNEMLECLFITFDDATPLFEVWQEFANEDYALRLVEYFCGVVPSVLLEQDIDWSKFSQREKQNYKRFADWLKSDVVLNKIKQFEYLHNNINLLVIIIEGLNPPI
jgi:hypothetical protein